MHSVNNIITLFEALDKDVHLPGLKMAPVIK